MSMEEIPSEGIVPPKRTSKIEQITPQLVMQLADTSDSDMSDIPEEADIQLEVIHRPSYIPTPQAALNQLGVVLENS